MIYNQKFAVFSEWILAHYKYCLATFWAAAAAADASGGLLSGK
jgi:hypothetical protein